MSLKVSGFLTGDIVSKYKDTIHSEISLSPNQKRKEIGVSLSGYTCFLSCG